MKKTGRTHYKDQTGDKFPGTVIDRGTHIDRHTHTQGWDEKK